MTPDQLAALHAQCFSTPRPWTASEFAGLIESKGTFLLTNGAGFALARHIAGEAELLTLAIDPAHRRQGHASQLMDELLSHLTQSNVSELFLEVSEVNIGARALYRHHGFEIAGRRKDYYSAPDGSRIDGLVLRKDL